MKNKPLVGLRILWASGKRAASGVKAKSSTPDNGKEYRCRLEVESGKKLRVRGFLAFSLLGRTQHWLRED
jgi:uncharacterized protein (DUF2147 family)